LIKGSKDSDSSLVSNENFGEILLSSSWALGQVTRAKIAKTSLTYDVTHNKRETQNQKFLFHCKLEGLPNLLRIWTASTVNRRAMLLERQSKIAV